MNGMYVHIKAVTYITFPNKQDFLPKLISTRGNVKHVSILAVCPYNVCDVLHCQLNMALGQAFWKRQKEAFVTMWKRITKTQEELWTNKWCYNALCIDILMISGIINLHNHISFVRYIDVFTIHSGVSFPLIVLIHVRYLNSLQKSLY